MSAAFPVFSNESLSPDEKLQRLRDINTELSESLRRLSAFQQRVLTIKQCKTVAEALDQMEVLLDETLAFVYARTYLRNESGELTEVRAMCPADISLDWSMAEWACHNQELAIIPLESLSDEEELRSLLLMPLSGHLGTVGLVALWLAVEPSTFTQEQSTLLNMLSRETAAVIETQRFRENIQKTRTTLEEVVESVPHGLLQIDAERRIVLINSTMEFMLDVRRADVLGHSYEEVLPKAIYPVLRRLIEGATSDEQEFRIDIRGFEETLGIAALPMRAAQEGHPAGHVIICRDLTTSRELVKLREIDAMKNDFISLVSHELRTPLTSIMAYSETLLLEGMVETEEERREYLEIIHSEGERLSRLINDVLDLTKMESGRLEYLYEDHDINDVIHTALAPSNSLIQKKSLTLETRLAEGLPTIKLDADRITQVLTNFLSNAVKFTPEGGTITVTSMETPPEEGQQVATVTVSVADTGIGIAPEDLNRVFSKFEQIEHIDHHSTGTGLGMPICKQIIEEGHAGKIWIQSEVDKGTTVCFRIPIS